MIPGIVAEQEEAASGGSVPPSSTWVMDFAAGVYTVGATSVTAGYMISRPDLISGGALVIPASGASTFIGIQAQALVPLLTKNWTIYFEVDLTDGADPFMNFLSVQAATTDDGLIQVNCLVNAIGVEADDFNVREASDPTSISVGTHKIAVTRTPAHIAISVDGDAATVDSGTTPDPVVDRAFLGGSDTGTQGTYRMLKAQLLDPVDPADLPALTT